VKKSLFLTKYGISAQNRKCPWIVIKCGLQLVENVWYNYEWHGYCDINSNYLQYYYRQRLPVILLLY